MVEHTTQEQEDMRESMIAVLEMFAEDDDTTSNSASNDKEVTATPASVETAPEQTAPVPEENLGEFEKLTSTPEKFYEFLGKFKSYGPSKKM